MKHHQSQTIHKGAYIQATDPTLDDPNYVQPYVQWFDTANLLWKYRNAGNSAWVLLLDVNTILPISYLDTDGTLAANSDLKIASQKAIKTYADNLIGAADAMVIKGLIDCSANPNYPAADAGWTYVVSVAGKIGGASGINVEVGDRILCIYDATASGNQATVGNKWVIGQTNIDGVLTTATLGVTVQAYSALLAALAGLTGAADKLPYFTGASSAAVTDLSSFIRTLLDDANAAAARTTLGAAGLTGAETLEDKRIKTRVGTTASSSTPTPNADTDDEFTVTALAANATFGAPSGTPTEGQAMIIRIKDNGTARTLAFNAIYRAIGLTLPTTTVISKTLYLGMIYNNADTKWDVVAVCQEG